MTTARIPLAALGLTLGTALAASAPQAGSGPFHLLMDETWISQAGGGRSGTYTVHAYDGEGKRVRTEIFAGFDGSGGLTGKRDLSYLPGGLLDTESIYQGDELESRIVHRYDAMGRLTEKVVAGGDGMELFRDAYGYDDGGRILSETRLKGGSPTSMRRLAYAADGSLSSDSLFEPEGAGLAPVQASLHGPGRVPGEKRETRWRRQDGAWYPVLDTYRLHAAGLVVSAAAYQVGGRRLDSSAFAYDRDGNRVLEERFDGAGRPLSRLVLGWKDTRPVPLRRRAAVGRGTVRGSLLLPGGTGWNLDGSDLLGRSRRQAFAAQGRE